MFNPNQEDTFPQREEKTLSFWQEKKIFEKSVDQRKNKPLFSFYDGPPFATGLPHYGHLLAGTIKDVIPRYKTMKGYHVPRRFGWDCHGLPVENEIEKEKKIFGAKAIEDFGIAHFNDECAKIVCRYTEEWKKTVNRMGRWVDFTKTYKTMDKSFMESVFWVFSELYKKGMVYEGFKVMPFSTQLGTPLSNFEASLNYKEVNDPSITIAFQKEDEKDTFFLAWTTTPWTLVSNLALIAGSDIDYVEILDQKTQKKYILAKALYPKYFTEDFTILKTFKGKDLEGKKYLPLFSYFASEKEKGAFRVLCDQFVSLEDGTGIVHAAPAFGEVDFYVCKRENIDLVCPVDSNGRFTEEVFDYKNLHVKEADKLIIRRLKEEKKLFHQAQILHRYPYCWRTDTPLIYKAVQTWFVAVEPLRERLLKANQKITWVPDHIKEGRFGKWLENARDWAISRNRYWGTPIPIWRSDDNEILVIGSVKELEEKTQTKIDNLHRQFLDDLTIEHKGKIYRRIPEVFDCWFESGAMPYAQNHYPFENKKETESSFPADFIAEGLDQTRGWFYTLTVLSVALFDEPAFKNVIVNGIILAEDGNKMSKRLKNYPDPQEVIDRYGADAIRLYMMNSPAVKAEDLRFSTKGVELLSRQVLIPFWNSFVFLSTYAKIYHWAPEAVSDHAKSDKTHTSISTSASTSSSISASAYKEPKALIDRWIVSCSQKLILEVESGMESYDLVKATDPLMGFIDQLTNWYIRRSRSRFWADEDSLDRREAFSTLYRVLLTVAKVSAPFIPFLAETIYQELKTPTLPESVHLCDFPLYDRALRDEELEKEMDYVQRVVSIGHALRKDYKIKVRQPLAKAHIGASDGKILKILQKQKNLIMDELNVKEIIFHEDEEKFVKLIAKPNFRILGKKVGSILPQVQKEIEKFDRKKMLSLLEGRGVKVVVEGNEIELTSEDVIVERKVVEGLAAASDAELAIALDTQMTEALLEEGLAREIVNKLNTMRREMNLAVSDRVKVVMDTTERVKKAFFAHKEYICLEVLAVEVDFGACEGQEWDLNGERAVIALSKTKEKS